MKSRFVLSTVMGLDLFFSANEDSIVYKLGGCFVESCNVGIVGISNKKQQKSIIIPA